MIGFKSYLSLSLSLSPFLFLITSDMKALGYESNVWIVTSLIIGHGRNQTTASIKRATELFDEFMTIEKRKDEQKKEKMKETLKNARLSKHTSTSMTSLYNSLLFAFMNNQTEEDERDERDEREDGRTMVDRSLALLQQMKLSGVSPDARTHSIVVKGLCYASKKFDKKDGRLKKYTRIACVLFLIQMMLFFSSFLLWLTFEFDKNFKIKMVFINH